MVDDYPSVKVLNHICGDGYSLWCTCGWETTASYMTPGDLVNFINSLLLRTDFDTFEYKNMLFWQGIEGVFK